MRDREDSNELRVSAWTKARRRVIKWLMWSAVVMVATYLAFAIPFWTRSPAITHHFVSEFNKEVAAIPQDERAWPLLRRAAVASEQWDEKEFPKGPPESTALADSQFESCRVHLDAWRDSMELVRTAAKKPRLGHFLGSNDDVFFDASVPIEERLRINEQVDLEADPLLFMMAQPWIGTMRKFTRAFALDMDVAAADGRADRVLDDVETVCLLADLVSDPPLVVSQLLGDAMRMFAAARFGRELAQNPGLFSTAQLARAAEILTHTSRHGSINLDWERRSTEDLAQRIFSDDGFGDGLMTIEGWNLLTALAGKEKWGRQRILWVGPLVAKSWGTRSQFEQFLNEVIREAQTEAAKPPWERTRSWMTRLEASFNSSDAPRSAFMVFAMVQALPRAFAARSTAQMELAATVAAIAAERFRLEHGRFPRTDAEMAAALGRNAPTDVFDGQPIRFRFDDGVVTIYSVGADRVDNGGEPAAEPQAARKWIHAEELLGLSKEQRAAIKGDLILWPPQDVEWADGSTHKLGPATSAAQ